jgi:hypothetical protein
MAERLERKLVSLSNPWLTGVSPDYANFARRPIVEDFLWGPLDCIPVGESLDEDLRSLSSLRKNKEWCGMSPKIA